MKRILVAALAALLLAPAVADAQQRERKTPYTYTPRTDGGAVVYAPNVHTSADDSTSVADRLTTLEAGSGGGGTTQHLSGNWGASGETLNLQLTPGNRIELTTPNELRRGGGSPLTDAQIGDKAFSNPPSDLTSQEQAAVRTAIGAGTGSGSSTPATPTVSVKTSDYLVVPGDKGSIVAYDGTADATFTLPDIEEASSATSADVSETGWSVTFFNLSNNSVTVARTIGDNLELEGAAPILRRGASVTFTVLEAQTNGSWGATASTIARDLSDYLRSTQSARVTGLWEFIRELTVRTPTANNSAANKGYVDDEVTRVVTAERTARTNADDARLQLSGGTLTGALTLAGAPTSDLHAATKKYVDDNAGSGGSVDTTFELVELGQLTLVGFSKDASARGTSRTSFGNIASFTGASQILSYNDLHGKIFTVEMPSRGGYLDLADLGTVNTPAERAAINGSTFFFCNTATVGAAAITIGGIGSVFPADSTIEPQGCVEIFLFAAPTTTAFSDGKFFNLVVSPHDEIEPRARYRASTSAPASNFGNDGDIVIQRQSATETRIYEKVLGTWHLRQTITSGGGGASLASTAPVRPSDNAGAAGSATTASRGDHRHPLPALANRTSGGLMSHGDKQQVDKIAGIEHRVSDLSATVHDNWSDLPNGNGAAFRMVGVNQASTLTSSAWGHRHQALLTNENYVVMMRIPLADSLAQYRLSISGAPVAPNDWSEGAPDATYRYFGGVGTIQAARNAFVQMQRSTRTYHTTYDGDLTDAAKRRLNLAGDTPRRGATLPATLPEGALFWLTDDDVLPETLSDHLFTIQAANNTQDRTDGGLGGDQPYRIIWAGAALADALYTGSPALGTAPSVFTANGIRAVYTISLVSGALPQAWLTGAYIERYFVKVASNLVSTADVNAGKIRLRLWVEETGGVSAEETLSLISDSGGVKTLATSRNTSGAFAAIWADSFTQYIGLRHTDDGWLHSDLSFDTGKALAKGLYSAANDNVPYAVEIRRKRRVLLAWDESRAYAAYTFPSDYAKWHTLKAVWQLDSTSDLLDNSIVSYEIPTSALSVNRTLGSRQSADNDNVRVLSWVANNRVLSGNTSARVTHIKRIVSLVLE